ncbi:MAG: VWA domain-containing protein [Thermomonas sp.]|nr:VWA domain-containing protein [Thermomonas sp.]
MKTPLRIGLLATAAFAATALYAANTARPATMLVLDASGSMWGQIDGKAKIAIARDAVGAMLDDWKGGDLGLMAYGHNRKGDCADIEVLQAIGPDTAAGIRKRVDALNPKGMTPISESVRQAAAQLHFTEQKATVILVSDGEETCSANPCALGKELEAAGVDFTAHVVGFDIQKGSKAHQQLQCLAANTGGRYVDAKDAGELNRALQSVAKAPASPPAKPKAIENLKPARPDPRRGGHMGESLPDRRQGLRRRDATRWTTAGDRDGSASFKTGGYQDGPVKAIT